MSSRARCRPSFSGPRLEGLGVPAPGQLLDRRDVDGAVVEVVLDLGQVAWPGSAGRCRSSCRTAARCAASGTCSLMKARVWRPGLLEGHRRRLDERQQARLGVHGAHEVVHGRHRLGGLVDDEVGALGDDLELVVGDEGGDLDDDVAIGLEARSSRGPSRRARRAKVVAVLELPVAPPRPRPAAARLRPSPATPGRPAGPGAGGARARRRTGARADRASPSPSPTAAPASCSPAAAWPSATA